MTGWTTIIPVKPWALAKSRLEVLDSTREDLARAFSLDVLECVLATPGIDRIVVVTAEPEMAARARHAGAVALTDRPMLSLDAVNDAVRIGQRWARVRARQAPIVVVPSDLAALTPSALTGVLATIGRHDRSFVPDLANVGTTLLAASSPALVSPAYGPDSARRHRALGCREALLIDPRARCDVDTPRDLHEAEVLGLSHHTSHALSHVVGRSPEFAAREVD
jgi:2-phospho-L-lactate guanylyltransferase